MDQFINGLGRVRLCIDILVRKKNACHFFSSNKSIWTTPQVAFVKINLLELGYITEIATVYINRLQTMGDKSSWDSWLNRVLIAAYHLFYFKSGLSWRANPPPPFSMLYRKEANSRDRKSNIEKGGGGSIVEIRKEICLKYSNMTKCLNTFVAHCLRR